MGLNPDLFRFFSAIAFHIGTPSERIKSGFNSIGTPSERINSGFNSLVVPVDLLEKNVISI